MVTAQQIQEGLRRFMTDRRLTPEEWAEESGVNLATVYRILKLDKPYSPRLVTVGALVESQGATISDFLAELHRYAGKPLASSDVVLGAGPSRAGDPVSRSSQPDAPGPTQPREIRPKAAEYNEGILIKLGFIADHLGRLVELVEARGQDAAPRVGPPKRPQGRRSSR